MASILFLLSTTICMAFFLPSAGATPLPGMSKSPNRQVLQPRSPLTNTAFTDWATNVIMVGGPQTYGMWVPDDGQYHDLSTIDCLDTPANAVGACDSPTIDQIGVVAGYGPCTFIGVDGWTDTIAGEAGEGYYTVSPPQSIAQASCG